MAGKCTTDPPGTDELEETEPGYEVSLIEDEGFLVEDESSLVEDEGSLVEDTGSLVEDEGSLVEDKGSLVENRVVFPSPSLVSVDGDVSSPSVDDSWIITFLPSSMVELIAGRVSVSNVEVAGGGTSSMVERIAGRVSVSNVEVTGGLTSVNPP